MKRNRRKAMRRTRAMSRRKGMPWKQIEKPKGKRSSRKRESRGLRSDRTTTPCCKDDGDKRAE